MSNIKISIVIATFNASKTLKRCLDSIVLQLTDETELILVDGGSKDNTNDIINSYGDKVAVHISEPDKGIYDAWNKGIHASHGEWIMFIGADDRLKPNALQTYLSYLHNLNHESDLISSKRVMVTLTDEEIYSVGKKWVWPSCLKGMPISHPGALHSRKLFKEIGCYDISFRIAADYDLLLRKGAKLRTDFIDKDTIIVSEGGISDSYNAIIEYYRALRKNRSCSSIRAFLLFANMYLHFSIKSMFRNLGVNIHS